MSERRGVIVDDGIVVNIVIWGDESQEQFSQDGFDRSEETTDWQFQPAVGWTWDSKFGYRPPMPYPSWWWDIEKFSWTAPLPEPDSLECEQGFWQWDEENTAWRCAECVDCQQSQ